MDNSHSKPTYDTGAPFVGRASVIQRLQQHMLDATDRHALLVVGRDGRGKSALLRYLATQREGQILAVQVPLDAGALRNEGSFIRRLIAVTNRLLAERDFTLLRLPDIAEYDAPPPDTQRPEMDLRTWFMTPYLDIVLQIIRPHRRLVWLFDDAGRLNDAIQSGDLPADMLEFLQQLLDSYRQLGYVLTTTSDDETAVTPFAPLVTDLNVLRLPRLTDDESRELIEGRLPTISADHAARLSREAGGDPRLLVRLCDQVSVAWQDTTDAEITAAIREVYQISRPEFKAIWEELTANERLVLTAYIHRYHSAPDQPITPAALQNWLIETDYPLDTVTIQAALRSLEYQDIMTRDRDAIWLVTGLQRLWLLEHARLDTLNLTGGRLTVSRSVVVAMIGGVLVLVLLFAIIGQTIAPRDDVLNGDIVPTVTLQSTE